MWEGGDSLHPVERAVFAVQAAHPEASYDAVADWVLGERNRSHAELHCRWFGAQMEAWTACPRCAERLEFQMDARAFAEPMSAVPDAVKVDSRSFRLPTSHDLARAAGEPESGSAAKFLLKACLLGGDEAPVWSEEEIDRIGEAMALADPMAETRLQLRCPSCGSEWKDNFDISAFFWAEVDARAQSLLAEVHTLASAYGWTEAAILSLSERRRRFYLERSHA